jgi:hypothetical protein
MMLSSAAKKDPSPLAASRSGPPLRLFLDGAVDASRSVADHEQRGRRAGARMFLEECPRLGVLLRAGHKGGAEPCSRPR